MPEGSGNPLARWVPGPLCGAQRVPWDPGTINFIRVSFRTFNFFFVGKVLPGVAALSDA